MVIGDGDLYIPICFKIFTVSYSPS